MQDDVIKKDERIEFRCTAVLRERLEKLARANDVTVSHAVRRMVENVIGDYETPHPRARAVALGGIEFPIREGMNRHREADHDKP